MRLLDDNPTATDSLGFYRLAAILHSVIRDRPQLPFVIGVFGEWGCGKTSLMRMVQSLLHRDGIKTVWFNAWKYDGKEVIWNALIQQIFYTIQNDPDVKNRLDSTDFGTRITETALNLAKYAAKVAIRFVPGGILKEEDVDAVAKVLRPLSSNDAQYDFINKFETTFDELVKEYVGQGGYLVVFIDDLDRCLPESAITVMEALKLYLDRSNCVFVIGSESSIIEEGIRQRYKDNQRLSAKEYLEKVIQLPFILPAIEAENALSLLDPYDQILPYRTDQVIRTLIVEGTACNPRRIKRFLNTFWVLWQIAGELSREERQHLAKILLLQMRFPKLYYALAQDLDLISKLTQITGARSEEREDVEEEGRRLRSGGGRDEGAHARERLAAFIVRENDALRSLQENAEIGWARVILLCCAADASEDRSSEGCPLLGSEVDVMGVVHEKVEIRIHGMST